MRPDRRISTTASTTLDAASLEIIWTQLVAVADEAAATLLRTSFSPIVQESNDYACALFDEFGRAVAENTVGIPSFNAVLSKTMRHVLDRFPLETWLPGDVVITNDPWLASGHLPDITCISPLFTDRLVGFAGSIAHMADIGGSIWSADAREVYEEGVRIPPMRLYRNGEKNETLFELLESNVRYPRQVLGDVHAQVAATHPAGRRVAELLAQHQLENLAPIADEVCKRAEGAMREAIRVVPNGVYGAQETLDGSDGDEVTIRAEVTVLDDSISVDYTGTSPQRASGLNCVYNYTWAYTCYPLKCVIDPTTPRNDGSYRPFAVQAPAGSILNPGFPAAVNARQLTGHALSSVVFRALYDAVPDRVIAGSGSAPSLRAVFALPQSQGRGARTTILFANGGMGARPDADGLDATCFPSNVVAGSMEVIEAGSSLTVWRKELRPDSGGVGQYRGGLGQDIEIEVGGDDDFVLSLFADRIEHPATGLGGGGPGATAEVTVNGHAPDKLKGKNVIAAGSRIRVRYAGGGGYGDPDARDPTALADDLRSGKVTDASRFGRSDHDP